MMILQVVPNRVLQLDGDMLCYECGHNDDWPFEQCTANFKTALQSRMAMSGAEYCNIHLTGANSGRLNTALVMHLHLPALRVWVAEHYEYSTSRQVEGNIHSIYHNNQTASEGIMQQQNAAIQHGAQHLSIIMSRNISLAMCNGLHCDWVTYDIKEASTSSKWPSMSEDTKDNIIAIFWGCCLVLTIITTLVSLTPAAAVFPVIGLVVWLCRKVKGCFTG